MFKIGYIAKTSGYEGFVNITLTEIGGTEYFIDTIGPVFIQFEGKPVPFFIESSIVVSNTSIRVKFDDYDTPAAVTPFIGCAVMVANINHNEENPLLSPEQLIGYTVVADSVIIVGKIDNVYDNRSQYLLSVITNQNREILIPLHEDLVEDIDEEKQTIFMQLPEGLL